MCNCKLVIVLNNFSTFSSAGEIITVPEDKVVSMTLQNTGSDSVALYNSGLQGETLVSGATKTFFSINNSCPIYYALQIPFTFSGAGTRALAVTKYYLRDWISEEINCPRCSQ